MGDSMNKKIIIIVGIIILVVGILLSVLRLNGNRIVKSNIEVDYPIISDESLTYEKRIFDTNYMHLVNIIIADKDWEDLIKNPLNKTKYNVDVEIDGIRFNNVSFKTKGNSSLNNIANGPREGPASNRYSFKINFGKYNKNQTYFGLDKLHLNNIYGDATYLNDYMSYETFRNIGISAPLDSFVVLKINSEDLGIYLAVEDVGESFFKRNDLKGNLYKPEQEKGNDLGASLTYKDDILSSYSNIFNNAETTVTEEDKLRLIESLKKLNNNEVLNTVDVDEVIRYFVAHNYLLSYDSYTGPSIHNYYLKEENGLLSIIPWDYNLAFGRFAMEEDTTFIANFGIDSPLYKATIDERPLWKWIVVNEEYRNTYHEVMSELITNYFESGEFNSTVDKTYELIRPYIKQDSSAFYNINQVDEAVDTLKDFCTYRTKSIRLQLSGELAADTKEQSMDDKVDASRINLEKMGLIAKDDKKQMQ